MTFAQAFGYVEAVSLRRGDTRLGRNIARQPAGLLSTATVGGPGDLRRRRWNGGEAARRRQGRGNHRRAQPRLERAQFVSGSGRLLNAYQGEELLDVVHQAEFTRARWDGLKPLAREDHAVPEYVDALLETVDVAAIRQRRFKVAVDCCNGACTLSTARFLQALGCEVLAINDEIGRPFPHDPEPNPDNMSQLRAMVKATGADIGFAQDAEGSRLGIVTEKWEALSEEYTLCIAADIVLGDGCQAGGHQPVHALRRGDRAPA